MLKEQYVLEAIVGRSDVSSDGYYTGKSYIFQGDRYAVIDAHIDKAKVYTSKLMADRASQMEFENYRFEAVKKND